MGSWKKNIYQERRCCAGLDISARPKFPTVGTDMQTIFEILSGARIAELRAAAAPQSWPMNGEGVRS